MNTTLEQIINNFLKTQGEIMALSAELEKKKEEYRAQVKAAFGVTDGEPLNIVQLVQMIASVQKMA